MLIGDVTTSGALPALEMSIRFAGERQRIIANNIANFETPDFRPVDVSPREFQRVLGAAVSDRRERNGGGSGALRLGRSQEVRSDQEKGFRLEPRTQTDGVLFHDRTNRDIERSMQDLVENASVFRVATELFAQQAALLRSVVSERP